MRLTIPNELAAQALALTRKTIRAARAAHDPSAILGAGMTQIVQLFESTLAATVATSSKHRRDGARLACGAGCDACCHIPLAVTALEAFAAAEVVRADQALAAHVRIAGPVVQAAAPAERWTQRVPCALLRDGRCQAYDARPLPCRAYSSFDADRCNHALRTGDRDAQLGIPLWELPHTFAAAVRKAVRAACVAEGVEDAHIELSGAVAVILTDSSSANRWLAGETVFAAPRA